MEERTETTRNELVVQYYPLVTKIVERYSKKLPYHADVDDLVSYGSLGLIDAINKFDPGLGYKFQTYASPRIQGSIVDGMRGFDWVPRLVREQVKSVERAKQRLEKELHRTPSPDEVAKEAGITVDQMQKFFVMSTTSIDRQVGEETDITVGDLLAATGDGPEELLAEHDLYRLIEDAVASLSEREQQIVQWYYFGKMDLKTIGAKLGVTESRICQIHTQIVIRLQRFLAEQEKDPVVQRKILAAVQRETLPEEVEEVEEVEETVIIDLTSKTGYELIGTGAPNRPRQQAGLIG